MSENDLPNDLVFRMWDEAEPLEEEVGNPVPQAVQIILGGILSGEDDMAQWWRTPIPAWGDVTPERMWNTQPERVFELIDSYYEPGFS